MLQSDDVGGAPQLDFEVWRALLRSNCGDSARLPQPLSSRYVRRLFAERGTTRGELIDSHRLDHAAHPLHHRALLGTGQFFDDITYAGGSRDDAHFATRFHKRFGYLPGAYAAQDSGDDAVRAGTEKSASPARDVAFRTS
jgi:AraC-like DNA-binding protein